MCSYRIRVNKNEMKCQSKITFKIQEKKSKSPTKRTFVICQQKQMCLVSLTNNFTSYHEYKQVMQCNQTV